MSNLERYKFRGLRLDGNGWAIGVLVYRKSLASIEFETSGRLSGQRLKKVRPVDPETVGQWTGKQVDGVDLYEGDLIGNASGRTAAIAWNDSIAGFDSIAKNEVGNAMGMGMHRLSKVFIIGNIHELLEQAQ